MRDNENYGVCSRNRHDKYGRSYVTMFIKKSKTKEKQEP